MLLYAGLDGELELRRDRSGEGRLRGRFPYNRTTVLSDGGKTGRPRKEQFASRAFAYRVEDPKLDIHILVGHDYNKPLASKLTGTLHLTDSADALTFDATITPEIAQTSYGKDVLAQMNSGLVFGLSPGFRMPPERAVPVAEKITTEPNDPARGMNGAIIRTVLEALLYELSIVTVAAYADATVTSDGSAPKSQDQGIGDQIAARNWNLDDATRLVLPRPHALARWRL